MPILLIFFWSNEELAIYKIHGILSRIPTLEGKDEKPDHEMWCESGEGSILDCDLFVMHAILVLFSSLLSYFIFAHAATLHSCYLFLKFLYGAQFCFLFFWMVICIQKEQHTPPPFFYARSSPYFSCFLLLIWIMYLCLAISVSMECTLFLGKYKTWWCWMTIFMKGTSPVPSCLPNSPPWFQGFYFTHMRRCWVKWGRGNDFFTFSFCVERYISMEIQTSKYSHKFTGHTSGYIIYELLNGSVGGI